MLPTALGLTSVPAPWGTQLPRKGSLGARRSTSCPSTAMRIPSSVRLAKLTRRLLPSDGPDTLIIARKWTSTLSLAVLPPTRPEAQLKLKVDAEPLPIRLAPAGTPELAVQGIVSLGALWE